jgi:hypothetical protein
LVQKRPVEVSLPVRRTGWHYERGRGERDSKYNAGCSSTFRAARAALAVRISFCRSGSEWHGRLD